MKTIVLFSRCELVHLYGQINKYLNNSFNVINLAYSEREESILRRQYNINQIFVLKKRIKEIYESEEIDSEKIDFLDKFIISNTSGRFCLNSSIQSDRTYTYLKYSESLKLSWVYYKFWLELFENEKFDFIIHEPPAIFLTQVAALVAKSNRAKYIAPIQVFGLNKFNWILLEGDDGNPIEIERNLKSTYNNKDKAMSFIQLFREKEDKNFFSEIEKKSTINKNNILWLKDLFKMIAKYFAKKLKKKGKMHNHPLNHIELFSERFESKIVDKLYNHWGRKNFKYQQTSLNDNYFYYPLHLEPEAVVLYYGDGLYKNQVKLIENIAAQLPPNYYLYVKDHPHGGNYRDYSDFKRIDLIPNVKLINPQIAGRTLIKQSKGVITINGLSGFEALLFGKPVFAFGNCFYKHFDSVFYVKNIKDFRSVVYDHFFENSHADDKLVNYISVFIQSQHSGFTSYFLDYPKKFNISEEENAKSIAFELTKFLSNY